jgi:uncharacterized membrane protein YraQ (UPF0718 family)
MKKEEGVRNKNRFVGVSPWWSGLSLPEMVILRKVIKIRLLAIFAGILFVSCTLTDYLFNVILG